MDFRAAFINKVMDMAFERSSIMSRTYHIFKPTIARRIPDPVFKKQHDTERHVFVMNVKDMPLGVSTDPNARKPNINKQVYKIVENSLLNRQESSEPNSFHLKNKGITIIAESVKEVGENEYRVTLDTNHGIVDGGHTYKLISDHIELDDLPENQFVFVEIRTGIKQEWIQDISGGLNTGVQVQAMSLDNLSGLFEQFKRELKKLEYERHFAWSENDDGELTARDLLSILICFNIDLYNGKDNAHPVEAYTSKASVLKKFEDATDSFNRLLPVLNQILVLYDTIGSTAGEIWNLHGGKTGSGGKAGNLSWMDYKNPDKKQKPFFYPFLKKEAKFKLTNGALYPILASFRWFICYDSHDKLKITWKIPFDQVLLAWNEVAMELLRATAELCDELGNNPNALGKSKSNWGNMYNIVKAHYPQI